MCYEAVTITTATTFFPTFPLAQDEIQIAPPTTTTTTFFSDTPPRHTTHPFKTSTHFLLLCGVLLWSTHTHTHTRMENGHSNPSLPLSLSRALSLSLSLSPSWWSTGSPSSFRDRWKIRPWAGEDSVIGQTRLLPESHFCFFFPHNALTIIATTSNSFFFVFFPKSVTKSDGKLWHTHGGGTDLPTNRRRQVRRCVWWSLSPTPESPPRRRERESEFRPWEGWALIFLNLVMMVRERERERERCSGKLSHVKRRSGDKMFWHNVRWERETQCWTREIWVFLRGGENVVGVFYAVWINQCDCLVDLEDQASPVSIVLVIWIVLPSSLR